MNSADFAAARREAEARIRQFAPAPLHQQLLELLQPGIALIATPAADAQISLGASKFGGAPDVPSDFEWPHWNGKALTFLAQINLEAVAPLDPQNRLPASGVLLFFVWLSEETYLWDEPDPRQGWRVLWAREPLHRAPVPADAHWIVPQITQSVSSKAAWILPEDWLEYDWDAGEQSEFGWEVLEIPPHRMLCCPFAPQSPPLTDAANIARMESGLETLSETVAPDDWELLLQLDTGARGFFEDIHDVGWLYFMARRQDLANGDFSQVWLDQQIT